MKDKNTTDLLKEMYELTIKIKQKLTESLVTRSRGPYTTRSPDAAFDDLDRIDPLIEQREVLIKTFLAERTERTQSQKRMLLEISEADQEILQLFEKMKKNITKEFSNLEKGREALKKGYFHPVEEIRPKRNFSSEG